MFSSGRWASLQILKYIHRMHIPHTYRHTLKKREKEVEEEKGGRRSGGKKKKRKREEEKEERKGGVMGRRGNICLT